VANPLAKRVLFFAHFVGGRLRINIVRIFARSLESSWYRFWDVTSTTMTPPQIRLLPHGRARTQVGASKMRRLLLGEDGHGRCCRRDVDGEDEVGVRLVGEGEDKAGGKRVVQPKCAGPLVFLYD
jgi:hypothetical protein